MKKEKALRGRPPLPPHKRRTTRSVRLRETVWQTIREKAEQKNVPVNNIIEALVNDYVSGRFEYQPKTGKIIVK